jgi:nitrous-oxide reductase
MLLVFWSLNILAGCGGGGSSTNVGAASLQELMQARNLTEADVQAALKTYTPTGRHDEYFIVSSGGHGGNMIIAGIPSMRILKYIGVFTPEPWQGFGYGDQSGALLENAKVHGKTITWADTHHPALSETAGEYDGQFAFLNDKNSPRIAVIDLSDFTTKQIVAGNLFGSEHGGCFVTPDTTYIIEASQYPTPLGGEFAPVEQYNEKYRGGAIFWKFDRKKGRIDASQSFAIEFPPYTQDLADAGKKVSDGWAFINSINTERAYGGNTEGRPPMESGYSQNDMDYLHVVNWRRAEELVKAGKANTIQGMRVLPLEVAAAEGVLFFVPEPKSPHGVDVAPDGDDIVVGGKLDTHTTVFSFSKIKALAEAKEFEGKDTYGVPILSFDKSIRGQCEIGLGPLHTQFDDKGFAYTSVFIESVVAKWSLRDLKVVEKIPSHYNVGHLATAEGDTVSPDGKYLVMMNKWALDRFAGVGPLLPQNFQLVDIGGEKLQHLYDMPIPLGEPHYAQIIKADKIKAREVYSPAGINPLTDETDPYAVEGGKERVERKADGVHVYMTAVRSHFTPDTIRVKEGDTVHLHITSIEQAHDATHGFTLSGHNIQLSLEPGEHNNVTFKADRPGVFPMYCTEFCSALHLEMAGYLLVEPAAGGPSNPPAPQPDAVPVPTPPSPTAPPL